MSWLRDWFVGICDLVKSHRPWLVIGRFSIAVTVVCIATVSTRAATYTWTGAAGNNLWSGSNLGTFNWSPNTLPPTTGDIALTQTTSFPTVDLQTNRTINSITFGGTQSYTLTDGTLALTSGVINANGTTTATTHAINAPITLGAAGVFTATPSATLQLQQPVNDGANNFGLTTTGAGVVTFKGAGTSNLYNLAATAGTLNINNSSITTRVINTFSFDFGTTTNVTNGSQLTNTAAGFLRVSGANTPVLTLDGVGTTATGSTYFVVGISDGSGAADIRNHAQVSTQIFLVASDNSGNAASTATIHTQASVTTSALTMGNSPGAVGIITVSDQGTTVQADSVLLGGFNSGIYGGTGNLTLSHNATITTTETQFFTSASSLTIDTAIYTTARLATFNGALPQIQITNPTANSFALMINNSDVNTTESYAGTIADGTHGAGSVKKTGVGTQIFAGHNTYSGVTEIDGGTLQLAISDSLSSTGPVTLGGGTLDLGGYSEHIGALTLNSGTLAGANGSSLLASSAKVSAGTISTPVFVSGNFTKQNAGTVTDTAPLTATTLSVTGGVLDSQGGVTAALGIASGGQLKLRGTFNGSFSAASGGTITITGGTVVTGAVNVSGTVDVGAQSLVYSAGDLPQVATTTLEGGLISAPDGYTLLGPLSGFGTVAATVASGSGTLTNSITASGGTLTIGTFAASDSMASYNDAIVVGSQQLNLLSSGQTSLGSSVTIAGGSLGSINGLLVKTGKTLSGYGTVNGPLQNSGSVTGGTGTNVLKFSGAVKGTGSFSGNVEFDGSYSPGNSPALVSFSGSTAFGSLSQLNIELGGTMRGSQYDAISSSGSVALGGALNVSLINGFKPIAGNSFDFLDWGSNPGALTGTFNTVNLPTLGGRIVWDSSQLYSTGALSVVATYYPGDFNRDGLVNVADVSAMEQALTDLSDYETTSGLNATELTLVGDLNGDGKVTNTDVQGLISLLANGSGTGSLTAVPEPASLLLFAIGGCAILYRRKVRRFRRGS